MTGRMQWSRVQNKGRAREQASPHKPQVAGPWSHIKRAPMKRLTKAEIAALLANRPDLQPPGSRVRGDDDEA